MNGAVYCKRKGPYRSVLLGLASAACLAMAVRAGEGDDPKLRVVQNDTTLSILAGERQILEYRYIESPHKPYVSKLFSPAGVQVLRDSPSDHKHHHALMFALAAESVNFWEEREGSGRERHRSLQLTNAEKGKGDVRTGFTHQLEWIDPAGKALILERRRVLIHDAGDMSATLLTWQSQLATPPGKESSVLTGSHYFGLGMRLVESMDRGGRFYNAEAKEGDVVRGSERLTAAKWCAYSASADGRPVTVAIFDHPSNPRHPARMFTMSDPFAYLAATLNLWKEPLTLRRDRPVELIYGVALWDGPIEAAGIERLYGQWTRHASVVATP